ncbi:general stress protein [Sutcliffiella halmapala]|uniref:general stress protein n=1 Tax=Sutcliffiella halmapala TaxID=79882 RepID=UPI000994E3C8|nr:general stress protein [Sutcliffiella halmapala]
MNRNIFGVYESELQAKNVVEGLIVQGYQEKEICVIAQDHHITSAFPRGTQVEKISLDNEESVVDKLKNTLLPEEARTSEGVGNRLVELGVSDRDAPVYATDVENGRIVVLVDAAAQSETTIVTTSPANEDTLGGNAFTADELDSNPFTGIDEETKVVRSGSNVDSIEDAERKVNLNKF